MKTGVPLEGYKRECPICGKTFWAMADWRFVYKKDRKRTYLCSWKHLREWTEGQENEDVQDRVRGVEAAKGNPAETGGSGGQGKDSAQDGRAEIPASGAEAEMT